MLRILFVIIIYIILMTTFITNAYADAYRKHMGRDSANLGYKLQNNLATKGKKSDSGDMADKPVHTSNRAFKRSQRGKARKFIAVRR